MMYLAGRRLFSGAGSATVVDGRCGSRWSERWLWCRLAHFQGCERCPGLVSVLCPRVPSAVASGSYCCTPGDCLYCSACRALMCAVVSASGGHSVSSLGAAVSRLPEDDAFRAGCNVVFQLFCRRLFPRLDQPPW